MFSKSKAYRYKPLDVSKDEIRVLKVLPGEASEELRCTMKHIPLDQTASYEALSYAWYDPTLFPDQNRQANEILEVDDLQLRIGSNLLSFLRTARAVRPETNWLWIDAISINQDDVKERNAQVLRMWRIYQMARQVVVWLGPEGGESSKAVEFLKFVYKDCPQGREAEWFETFLSSTSIAVQWKALTRLLWRVWWTRVWIVQEIVLAREVTVLCGTSSLRWIELEHSIHKVTAALDNVWKHVSAYGGLAIVRDRVNSIARLTTLRRRRREMTTLDVLENVGGNDCTDPRDKIFGLLGLIKDAHLLMPVPDYTRSPENVHRSFFVYLAMKAGGNLDFLSLVHNGLDDTSSSTLPTWCPDLRSPEFRGIPRMNTALILAADSIPQFCASGNRTSAATSSKDRNILTLPGLLIDAIDGVFPGGYDSALILKYTIQPRSAASPYGTEAATFEALWKSFVAGLNLEGIGKDFNAPAQFGEHFARLCCAAELEHQQLCNEGRESMYSIAQPLKRPNIFEDKSTTPFKTWYKYNRGCLVAGRSIRSWTEHNTQMASPTPTTTSSTPLSQSRPSTSLPLDNAFQISWTNATAVRRLVTTEKGYIGMVPELSRRGDLICVLFGSRMPVVLRPKGRHYLFIGDCYVHGLMFGKALEDMQNGLYRVAEFGLY